MRFVHLVVMSFALTHGSGAFARPHAGFSGLAAAADNAATTATNPAGITRFDERAYKFEILGFFSESAWEGRLGDGPTREAEDTGGTIVPVAYVVNPINERLSFGFTVLGFGFSDDLGDWAGRYFLESYDAVSLSAYPSLAYKVNDKLSIAGSALITYSSYDQDRAVANLFDPGLLDGTASMETDGFDVGFGLSLLYEINEQTRLGLVYQSGSDPEMDGKVKFKGLGQNTEAVLDKAGFIGADLDVKSKTPQSLLAGVYHEFPNQHAVTLDVAWVDFSEFQLSEFYFDGEAFVETETEYEDFWAISLGYSWPLFSRWMLGVNGLYVAPMIDDDERTMILRLDEMWSVGIAAEWQWKDDRAVQFGLSYMSPGDAPVTTPDIPGIGASTGKFTDRHTVMLRAGLNFGGF